MLLNDTDPLYKRLKHMHIAELSTQLHAEYKALVQSSRTLTLPVTHPHPNPDPDPDPNPEPKPGPSPEQAFLESNKSSAALSKGNANDVRAMAEGLKAMPKFQEETARYSLHIHVVSELLKKFNEGCLEEVRGLG